MRIVLFFVFGFGLVVSSIWLYYDAGFSSLISVVTMLASLISLRFIKSKKQHGLSQTTGDNSIAIQSGANTYISTTHVTDKEKQ
ncbi:hypothetical protein [Cobetia amphilecti]|uniref:hypothetical protein n=1 Tax=Cobetia amphilecti TaxID=1055104 RepID=UPI0012EBCBCD|nr:hypothetical protein [Cobetia amphilecti]